MNKKGFTLLVIKYKLTKKLNFIDELQNLFNVTVLSCDNGIQNRNFKAAISRLSRPPEYRRQIVLEDYNLYHHMSAKQEACIFLSSMVMRHLTGCSSRHSMRTKFMLKTLVDEALKRDLYSDDLSIENNMMISNAALFHDLGKLGISPSILAKPGKLTQDEYDIIKTHTTIGRDMLLSCKNILGHNDKQIQFISEVVYSHHERWDGSGYPQGLKGEEIPVSARLMAIADVYDAMTSRRIYKEACPHEEAAEIILKGAGTHFDPQAVELFIAFQTDFHDIASYYSDKLAIK